MLPLGIIIERTLSFERFSIVDILFLGSAHFSPILIASCSFRQRLTADIEREREQRGIGDSGAGGSNVLLCNSRIGLVGPYLYLLVGPRAQFLICCKLKSPQFYLQVGPLDIFFSFFWDIIRNFCVPIDILKFLSIIYITRIKSTLSDPFYVIGSINNI